MTLKLYLPMVSPPLDLEKTHSRMVVNQVLCIGVMLHTDDPCTAFPMKYYLPQQAHGSYDAALEADIFKKWASFFAPRTMACEVISMPLSWALFQCCTTGP
jgi:hypothetical protein